VNLSPRHLFLFFSRRYKRRPTCQCADCPSKENEPLAANHFSAAQPAHNKQLIMIKSEGEIVIGYEGEPLHTIDQDGNVSSDD
jgi:hypothetical protein